MTIKPVTALTLRGMKNSVIGNPTAKAALGNDEAFVAELVNYISNPPHFVEPSSSIDEVRIESAHILASLSYGSSSALSTLLRLEAHQAFLYAITQFQPSTPLTVKAAFARALRAITVAISDAVGPSQWGIAASASDARSEAKVALDSLFAQVDVFLPLLTDSDLSIFIAQLLAFSVRTSSHRAMITEWSPPSERAKEAKGKRGWERRDTATSPYRQSGWVTRALVDLLHAKDIKLQVAALSALASLAVNNEAVAYSLVRASYGPEPVLSLIVTLCKSRLIDLQLSAALCATNIIRATSPTSALNTSEPSSAKTVMHVLNNIIASEEATTQAKTRACFILYHLVSDHKAFCQLAYERGSLAKVAALVKSTIPNDKIVDWDEDEPESISRLREAGLTAVAAISLFDVDIRCEVTDSLKLVPAIQSSLSHHYVGVRYAACQCARALSRAVAVLRTNIIDTGLGVSVFKVFMKRDEDRRVVHAASSVVCNLVNDFSPLRSIMLEQGVITRLTELLHSDEPELRLNALWAFKNMLYRSTPELKRRVMDAIGWDNIKHLLEDHDSGIQEQAYHIVRHIADGVDDVDLLFQELGSDILLNFLAVAMESDREEVVLQAVYVLANVANSPLHQSSILGHPRLLGLLKECLVDAKVQIRRPAISCVLELVRQNPHSHRPLHEVGIDITLRHMCEHTTHASSSPTRRFGGRQMGAEEDQEVQEKARQALHWLEHSVDMDV